MPRLRIREWVKSLSSNKVERLEIRLGRRCGEVLL